MGLKSKWYVIKLFDDNAIKPGHIKWVVPIKTENRRV